MKLIDLSLQGLKLIQLDAFEDDRGFFKQTYQQLHYRGGGISCDFVQDNHSFSKKGVVRGMHFQSYPGQHKLVSVTIGSIYDVVVDIRPDSPTFKKWLGIVLDAKTHEQLFIPIGFAHGFCVLSEEAHVTYKVSSVYDPASEKSFRFDDPEIGIVWPVSYPILSDRDRNAPCLREVVS